jgi:hypothetical protein
MTQSEAHEDSLDPRSMTSRLRHVYWIGGASGCRNHKPYQLRRTPS